MAAVTGCPALAGHDNPRKTKGRERSRPFFLFDIDGFAPPSSSAKADDPVHRGFSAPSLALAITGCPAFAGHDDGL
jgi:hypothetical protein